MSETNLAAAQSRRALNWGRVYVLLIVLAMTAMLGRVVQLKLMPDPRLAPAVGTPISTRDEVTRRGDLLDRVGRVIATSTIGFRLFVDPKSAAEPDTLAVDLATILKKDPIEIDRKISEKPDSRFIVVAERVEDWQVDAVRQANLKGVGLEPRLIRHYPHNDLAAGIVGKVGFEHSGQGGFEHIFNADMIPTPGKLTFLRDVRRQALWIDPHDYEPGRNGQDVRLSIDLVVQEFAEKRLRQAVEEYNAGGGRMVVIDCNTGEILAMTDILNHRKGWTEQIEDPLRKVHPALGRNRCVTDPYEPGSTFKPFIWAAATDLGKAHPDELLPTPEGPWRTPYGRTIRDVHYYGPSSWRKVLVKSMNSGMAMVAERLTHREMQDAVKRFGFGSKTGCGLPGETAGIVTSPKQWKTYTQSSVAIGQEIAVTPLQMVRAFSAFARDGTMVNLRFTLEEASIAAATSGTGVPTVHSNDNGASILRAQFNAATGGAGVSPVATAEAPAPVHRAVSPRVVEIAREAMKGVMEEGTGRAAQSKRYQMFGKSGTAQLPKRNGKGYYEDRYVASFIAGAPFEQPRIIALCVIDDPDRKKGHFGGAIAGPVVRDVIDETLTYMGVAPDQPQEQVAAASD